MPSYDYRCQDCKNEFTVERSMNDSSEQACVSCGSAECNRIWNIVVVNSGGSTPDYGQNTARTAATTTSKSGCGSCVSKACGTCH